MRSISEIAQSRIHYDGLTLIERMKECHVPAVSMALVENFELREAAAFGVKRRAAKDQATPDTLFQAASISKPVFAAAIMRLAEAGRLDIDADVAGYLGDFHIPTYDGQKHRITLRQMLSHQAGFNLHGFSGYQKGQRIPTVDQIVTGAPPANHIRLKLAKAPESGYQYSGGGYVLAQKVMETVCNQKCSDLMDSLVCAPLGMARSTYAQPLPQNRRNEMAAGYNTYNLQLPGGCNTMPELAAAGLWTTPSDLARFGIAIMKALKGEGTFLRKESARLMTTSAYENAPYGVGFAVHSCEKGATFGHSGSNVGYNCNMVFCPAEGSGMVIMQNADIGRGICMEATNAFKALSGW